MFDVHPEMTVKPRSGSGRKRKIKKMERERKIKKMERERKKAPKIQRQGWRKREKKARENKLR